VLAAAGWCQLGVRAVAKIEVPTCRAGDAACFIAISKLLR
jgi:hypothetical protein